MSCDFTHLDGAYALGALAADERAAYERHLPDCAECSRALGELSDLPGLLARVPREVVEELERVEPVPDTLLPGLMARLRTQARRRRRRVIAVAAAAVVLLGGVAVSIGATRQDDAPQLAAAQRMQSLGSPSSGWVSLTGRRWGTRIDLTCTYEGPLPGTTTYVLVVRSANGRSEQVGSWRSARGQEVHVTLATSTPPADIASVEVRTASGYSVLRLTE
ncbi:zf-HC2 domain-containing protein [Nocardioides ginsengisoli]|uniref:Anti-sigma factor n=1 Tax=Nocardioides ginsengisoli TaxID=363868 RepID=A0ABW3VUT0_9ACTN